MTTTLADPVTTAPTPSLAAAAPAPVEELLQYMSQWETGTARLPWVDPLTESGPEPQHLYVTEEMAGPAVLQSWVQFRDLLEEVIARADADPDAFQYLTLIHGEHTSIWTQMTPLGPDQHYVELSDGAGWVDELVPADPQTPWSTDQTEAIMRLWVTQRFQRADAQRSAVPR